MYFLKLFFILFVFFLVLFLLLQNGEEKVTIYFFKYTVNEINLFWVLFYSFIAGSFFAWFISAFQEIRYRMKIHSQKREIENLKIEIHNLRKMSIAEEEVKEKGEGDVSF